jgi:ribosomal protein L3 glutamine methyltransferase
MPAEYGHEPALGLYSGTDGLDSARRILQDAPALLSPGGILVLEVGAQWEQLGKALPELPFTWVEFERGGTGVGVLQAADLQAGHD